MAFAQTQGDVALAEFARKAQDPLGNVKALMTDNTISFDGGPNEDTSYGFQLQPVYAVDNETRWNIILRGIVPVAGLEPGVVAPPIGPEPRPPGGSTWGISDSIFQVFFSPKSTAAWKWGIGPQVSLKTSTSDRLDGAGWGAGIAGVVFGGVGDFSLGVDEEGCGQNTADTIILGGGFAFVEQGGEGQAKFIEKTGYLLRRFILIESQYRQTIFLTRLKCVL